MGEDKSSRTIAELEASNAELVQAVADLTRKVNHWRKNHDNVVRRARLLFERPDMPVERCNAYQRMADLQRNYDELCSRFDVEIQKARLGYVHRPSHENDLKAILSETVSHLKQLHSAAREFIADPHEDFFEDLRCACDKVFDFINKQKSGGVSNG